MGANTFERKEIKYIITREQYRALLRALEGRMQPDEFGVTRICNIYFDTPDFRLIRESIEKPMYKEKLRLRTYGVPDENSRAFIELKKKFDKVVYKRRVTMRYIDAMRFLVNREKLANPTQIEKEIEWVLNFYKGLAPAMVLCYDRQAYFGVEDPTLRMTFDTNINFRTKDFNLMCGSYGETLMDDSTYILELKINYAMPLWLSAIMDRLKIYPGSYTKYGNAYKKLISSGGIL
ncbi:MAG: polyphosphate polymerase domain-containing protein [Clostridiales bacterium]|nr:polyphosphate polymerase domain-containing protein [Clostridiales bacterium]